MKIVVVGRGILGSSLYHLLRRKGHVVRVIESGERRVFPSLIHSLLLKDRDIELARMSLDFYREFSVPMKEFVSITLGKVESQILNSWERVGVEIREEHVSWLKANGIVARGGDRLVYISRLISSVPFVRGKAKIDLLKEKVYLDGKEIHADKYLVVAGPWNPCLLRVKTKSYYCWATLVASGVKELGNHFVYDYEKGFYSRPLLGLGTGIAIVGDGRAIESPPGRRIPVDENEVLDRARERLGSLHPLYTAGEFCEGTPDMRPAYGPITDKILYAGGLDGYGAEVGPGLAKLIIKFIETGEKVQEYFLDRFTGVTDFTVGREPHEI